MVIVVKKRKQIVQVVRGATVGADGDDREGAVHSDDRWFFDGC